jgi:hypothetical protein
MEVWVDNKKKQYLSLWTWQTDARFSVPRTLSNEALATLKFYHLRIHFLFSLFSKGMSAYIRNRKTILGSLATVLTPSNPIKSTYWTDYDVYNLYSATQCLCRELKHEWIWHQPNTFGLLDGLRSHLSDEWIRVTTSAVSFQVDSSQISRSKNRLLKMLPFSFPFPVYHVETNGKCEHDRANVLVLSTYKIFSMSTINEYNKSNLKRIWHMKMYIAPYYTCGAN